MFNVFSIFNVKSGEFKRVNSARKGLRSAFLSILFGGAVAGGFAGASLVAHSYYDPNSIDLDAEMRKDRALFEEIDAQDRAFKVDLRRSSIDFDATNAKQQDANSETFFENDYLVSHTFDARPAEYYMAQSLEMLFDDTANFECAGNARSAECRAAQHEINDGNIILKNFRYTLDYKKERTIERITSDIVYPNETYFGNDISWLLPTRLECADFTQFHGSESRINEQLVCTLKGQYAEVDFRIRAKSHSPLFKNMYAIRFLKESSFFLDKVLRRTDAFSGDKSELLAQLNEMSKKTLSKIDTNIYSIELNVKKPHLPQKVYEFLFDIDDELSEADNDALLEASGLSDMQVRQITKGIYNSGVGYIYGAAMGYVLGNDNLSPRTKEGLTKALLAFRDSAMVGSNVSRVSVKFTNRTKEGVNLAEVFKAASDKLAKFDRAPSIRKEHAGRAINTFDADVLNRYRIEVGVYRLKPNSPNYDKHGF